MTASDLLAQLRAAGAQLRLKPVSATGNPPADCPACKKEGTTWLPLTLAGRYLCARCYAGWGTPLQPTYDLQVTAPAGTLTPDLAARLRKSKPALIETLKSEGGSSDDQRAS